MAADLDVAQVWQERVSVAEATRGTVRRKLSADEEARQRIAKVLGLDALNRLEADVTVSPWLDGVQIEGKWTANVVQTCGVTLDPFESALSGQIHVRALPQGSAALGGTDEHEIELDPDADDPPDVLEGDQIEVGAYVVEDLSLAIDPFPRKPDATFEAPEQKGELSPFAVLAKLKGGAPDA
jgi:uncharacterized metal-binding protein YceD (DUF177 family)